MAATDGPCSSATLCIPGQLDSTSPDTDAAGSPRDKRGAGHNAQSGSRRTAPSAINTLPRPKRAKFDPRRRQQVANVRKRGACMRCRVKKLPCSGSVPCGSCLRNQAIPRVTFDRWEQCISFSWKEANIYVFAGSCDETTYNTILGNPLSVVVENVCQGFDDMIKWDVASISSEFVLWMTDDDAQSGSTSLVGLLSSSAFESMISKFVDRSLSKNVKLLVQLTTFLYSCASEASYADCDLTSTWNLCSSVGSRVLQELEQALSNASLAAASLERLTALFAVQFATIIAVGYWKPRSPSGDLGASTFVLCQSPTPAESWTSESLTHVFSDAQEDLLRILAHHMVYIAERINLLEPKVSRKRIIEGSASRWNRRPTFQRTEMPAPKGTDPQSRLVSSCDFQDNPRQADRALPAEYPARCYHLSRSHTIDSSCRLVGGFGTCIHEQSLNSEPSPLDHLLANCHLREVQARPERTSTPRVECESVRKAAHPTRSRSSDHLPSMSARDRNYAAFECLAETDEMCAPFLCTDNEANANEASSTDETSALPLTTSPSAPQTSDPPSSTASNSQSPASIPSQRSTSTHATTSDRAPVCRSCNFATLLFDALDQDDLCQFCSALPRHPGDVADDLPDQTLPAHSDAQLGWLTQEHGAGNLLV